ncbi:MAG: DUF1893 domain-containing protein [Clostridiales bacterium]|nr:DUF1893 domain-containing protein [Clostridiales bacterium]
MNELGDVAKFLSSRSVVFSRGGMVVYESTDRGIKPLVAAVDSGVDYSDCDAADRIVGKAAANLYILLRIHSVRACVMTQEAKSILTAHGIDCEADTYTENIVNRNGDGLCPMEMAVKDTGNPDDALKAIHDRIAALQAAHGGKK